MLKEERFIREKFGKKNPFSVPDGYFDSFADKLMEQLPEPQAQVIEMRAESWWRKLPLRKVAAIIGVAAFLGGGALFFAHNGGSGHAPMATNAHHQVQPSKADYDGSFDQMADYAMLDNQDIYATLVAEN